MLFTRKLFKQLRACNKFAVIYPVRINKAIHLVESQRSYVFNQRKYLCSTSVCNFHLPNSVMFSKSAAITHDDLPVKFNRKLILFLENVNQKRVKYEDILYVINGYENDYVKINAQIGIILLRSCSDTLPEIRPEARINLAHKIWHFLKLKNIPLNVEMYNMLLKIYIENNHEIDFHDFIKNMSVIPNEKTYEFLVHIAANTGNYESASKIIKIMKDKNFIINEHIFNLLILLHANQKNVKEALSVLEIMESSFIETSSETYSYLALAFIKILDFENVFKILESHKCQSKHIMNIIKSQNLAKHKEQLMKILNFLPGNISANDHSVINTIIDLIQKCRVEDALSILSFIALNNKSPFEFPKYFLKAIVEANISMETTLKVIQSVDSSQVVVDALTDLAEICLIKGEKELTLNIFEALKEKDQVVKPHYYWPLILRTVKIEGESGLFEILKHMKKLDVKLDFDSLFYYVLPYINLDYSTIAYKKLLDNSTKNPDLLTIFLSFLLKKGFLKSAIAVRKEIPGNIEIDQVIKFLVKGYIITKDIKHCALLLKMLKCQYSDMKIFFIKEQDSGLIINEFIQELKKYKITINASSKQNNLQAFVAFKQTTFSVKHPREMNLEELELHLTELRAKKMNTRGVLRLLLQAYCSKNNFQQAEKIRNQIEENNFVWSAGMRASLFSLYTLHGMLDKAYEQFNKVKTEFNKFIFDDFKIVNFACALIKDGKIDTAMDVLRRQTCIKGDPAITKNCWALLNTLAHSNDSRYINEVFNILVHKGYCKAENITLGPLIRIHLVKGDVSAAVNTFRKLVQEYNVTPLKQEIMKSLVELDDGREYSEMLEEVHSLVQKIYSKNIANANLVVALAQCNKQERLNEFLSKNIVPINIIRKCLDGLPEQDKSQTVINLLESCNMITNMDTSPLYDLLLSIYSKEGKFNEATALWEDIQRRKVFVNKEFKRRLFNLFNINNVHLPKRIFVHSNVNKN